MTRGDLPQVTILGRPFKPLAVGLIIASTILGLDAVHNLFLGVQILTYSTPVADWVAMICMVLMVLSWFIRSQRLYEASLLLLAGAWLSRGIEIALLGVSPANAVLPVAMAVMAGGAYVLEVASPDEGVG